MINIFINKNKILKENKMSRTIRLTERDLSRIVKRVINEQKTVADQSVVNSYKNFKNNIVELTGISGELGKKVSLILFGLSTGYGVIDDAGTTKLTFYSTGEDLETRLKKYDEIVTKNSLNLPSSSIIKLFKQIV